MCGIVGVWQAGVSVEDLTPRLELGLQSILHRGPDDRGSACFQTARPSGALGIGNARLAILDLSVAGHQPMCDPLTGNWIVFNGEIYNFRAVRADLESRGCRFQSQGDTEVVLQAYRVYGPQCVARFNGIFAFAIWQPTTQTIFLARDHLGVKPLYYSGHTGQFLFASEIRAILNTGLVARRLSLHGLQGYLALGAALEPHTIIADIVALPPGHFAVWHAGEVTIEPYWQLPTQTDSRLASQPRAVVVEQLRSHLSQAVQVQLISDAPLGAFLSGGIDSTAIVSLMRRNHSLAPRTVSIVFEDERYSEATAMRAVARQFETEHTEVMLTPAMLLADLPAALSAMDQPTFDGLNTYIVSKHTRATGLKVALSGLGGDELFGGYPNSFKSALALERWRRRLPGPLSLLARFGARAVYGNSDRGQKLARWFAQHELEGGSYHLVRELFAPPDRRRLAPALRGQKPLPLPEPRGLDDFNRISHLEITHYMRNVLLRDSDVLSMAHGLELRVPLLDYQLVEFMLRLPRHHKQNGHSHPKALLIEAVGDLPAAVTERPKQGFTLPLDAWMKAQLRPRIEEVLLPQTGQRSAGLDPIEVQQIWQRFLTGQGNWVRPWALFVLQHWCSQNRVA